MVNFFSNKKEEILKILKKDLRESYWTTFLQISQKFEEKYWKNCADFWKTFSKLKKNKFNLSKIIEKFEWNKKKLQK